MNLYKVTFSSGQTVICIARTIDQVVTLAPSAFKEVLDVTQHRIGCIESIKQIHSDKHLIDVSGGAQ